MGERTQQSSQWQRRFQEYCKITDLHLQTLQEFSLLIWEGHHLERSGFLGFSPLNIASPPKLLDFYLGTPSAKRPTEGHMISQDGLIISPPSEQPLGITKEPQKRLDSTYTIGNLNLCRL